MKKKLMLLLACLFVGISLVTAQTQKVTGVVISEEDGQPVVGASVLVKGTTLGTITDVDGNFNLSNVPSSAKTLQVSYIGMQTQEVAIKPNLKVVLKSDTQQIDEVMVVAYGTAKRSAFTGSATTIKTDKIAMRQVSSATQVLSGAAGVMVTSSNGQPGTDSNIRIRGVGSMASSSKPLYIVDGAPYDGLVSNINTADIESMSVLKDAAASAIYGARGANGVVIITTKQGKGNRDAKVTLDAKWGTNKRAIPNYDVVKNPQQYMETHYASLYNSQYYNANEGGDSEAAWQYANKAIKYNIYTLPTGEQLIGKNGKLNPNATLGFSDGDYYYTPDDWYDEIFGNNNLRQEYNLNIVGSTDKMNYYMSLGYLDDSGIIPNSAYKRYSARFKADYQVKSWLKVGANVSYVNVENNAPGSQTDWGSSGNIFYTADNIAPIFPIYVRTTDGQIARDEKGNILFDNGTSSTNQTRAGGIMGNPMNDLTYNSYKQIKDIISANGFAMIDIYKGLRFTANLSANVSNSRENDLTSKYYGSGASSDGAVSLEHLRTMGINQQYLLSYKRTFGKSNIDILAGYESYSYKTSDFSASLKKLYLDDVAELNNAILSGTSLPKSSTDTYSTRGFLFRAQYDFDETYFLSASYRRDASSRFAPSKRWGNFGSIGAAWILTKEGFMENTNSWLDMLKFKASLGYQGNDNLLYPSTSKYWGESNYHAWQDQYLLSESNGNYSFALDYKGNEDITWEKSLSFNTGFDFSLFKSRLTGTIEYYSRKTTDMLYNMPVAASKGYSYFPKNVGSMVNNGIELDLSGNAYRNKDISVDLNFNITTVHNEITALDPSISKDGIKSAWDIKKVGSSNYQAYLKKYAGVDPANGDALWYYDTKDNNGKVTGRETTNEYSKATTYDCGNTLATVFGGFGINVTAYGFDLSTQLSYQLGGKIYDYTYSRMMASNAGKSNQAWHSDILKAWTEDNPNTNVPRLDNSVDDGQNSSDRYLVSSDFLSLNNITLGYTLPTKLLRPLSISSLRVYLVGDNLALFNKRKGIDPRSSIGGTNAYSTANHYSAIKTFSAGISVTF